jgi:guanylate kinase
MLLIVAGPSGVGKSRLIDIATKSFDFARAVPVTSRMKRPREEHGVDYEFVSKSEFRDLIRGNLLCAWDFTLNNYYGYRRDLEQRLQRGEDIVIQALSRMGLRMSKTLPDAFLLFLESSSPQLLNRRLAERKYDQDEMRLRRDHWQEEQEHSSLFDFVIRDADCTPTEDLTKLLADVLTRFR